MLSIPGRDAIKIETPTFTGGIETTEVEWKDIELPVGYHMFQTFQCGKSGKKFWLDDLGERCTTRRCPRGSRRSSTRSEPLYN